MPQVTVYIRKEDLPKWETIEKKSLWLHNRLQTISVAELNEMDDPRKITPKADLNIANDPNPETGYPCCTKDKPCKHWSFDGTTSTWTNEITGATREVVV